MQISSFSPNEIQRGVEPHWFGLVGGCVVPEREREGGGERGGIEERRQERGREGKRWEEGGGGAGGMGGEQGKEGGEENKGREKGGRKKEERREKRGGRRKKEIGEGMMMMSFICSCRNKNRSRAPKGFYLYSNRMNIEPRRCCHCHFSDEGTGWF
jgi:hypothetical protein